MPSLDARSFQDGEVGCRFVQYLTLQNAAVLERKVEHVAVSGIGCGVESDDRRGRRDPLEHVSHAPQIPLTTVKSAHAAGCLSVGHRGHFQ